MQAPRLSPEPLATPPSSRPADDWTLHDIIDGLTGPDVETALACANLVEAAATQFPDALRRFEFTLAAFSGICREHATKRLVQRALNLLKQA
jgi:hypothetical protein